MYSFSRTQVNVVIEENGVPFCNLEREINGVDVWETVTYVAVRQLTTRTQISLKISSSAKSSSISSDSTYSIVHLASLRPDECNSLLRNYHISKDTPVVPYSRGRGGTETGFRTKNWAVNSRKECNSVYYSDEFRVASSGYYLISLELFLNRIPTKPIKVSLSEHPISVTRKF